MAVVGGGSGGGVADEETVQLATERYWSRYGYTECEYTMMKGELMRVTMNDVRCTMNEVMSGSGSGSMSRKKGARCDEDVVLLSICRRQ